MLTTSAGVEVGGNPDRLRLRDTDPLRVAPPDSERGHAVPRVQSGAASAELLDLADELVAGVNGGFGPPR
jgi:hypothetical protein